MRLKILMALKMQVEVSWNVTPCSVVVGYQVLEDLAASAEDRRSSKTVHGITTQKAFTWSIICLLTCIQFIYDSDNTCA
jgi:hypothetical protein